MKYIVITPVRNESKHLKRTIDSMVSQTCKPSEWIIVDDGSTDGTTQIIQEAAHRFPWIRLVQRADRGFRKAGAGVVEAFYEGFNLHRTPDWELLVKLDGDLEFEATYFANVIEAFRADIKLGIAGGDIYHFESAGMVIESRNDPAFHVRGANKTYRRDCWDTIGGLFSITGWDTLDEVKANMLGWTTRRLPQLRMLHLKPTGAADGTWKNAFKNGRGSYICGYHPMFICARSMRCISKKPFLIQSLGLLSGYFSGVLGRKQRVPDPALIRYLRSQQFRRMVCKDSLWD